MRTPLTTRRPNWGSANVADQGVLVMTSKTSLLCHAGLGVLAALCISTGAEAKAKHHVVHDRSSELARQVSDLEAQIQSLESWRNDEAAQHDQDAAQIAGLRQQLADTQTQAQAAQMQAQTQIQTIPNQVKSAVASAEPNDGKIHFRGGALTIGGFAAAESVYRSRNQEADIGSAFQKIPFNNAALAHTGEWRGTARQSRLSLLAQGDINPTTHAAFYSEFDFLGAAQTANSNESNSYQPRIRHVYGTLDFDDWGLHLLAGQTWSLATLNNKGITPRNEITPLTIDAQYVVGFNWTRQPQFRITKDFANKQLWAAVSVENPQTTFAGAMPGASAAGVTGLMVTDTGVSASQFNSLNALSLNQIPDVIGKLAFEPDLWGGRPLHLEVYGLYRSFYDRVNVTSGSNVLGLPVGASNKSNDGGGVGWGVTFAAVPKILDLQFSGLTGKGIGRYGSGSLPDAVVGADGSLKPIQETELLAGATLHAMPTLDIYGYYGQERESSNFSKIGASYYGFGTPTGSLAGCSVEGGACSPDLKEEEQFALGLWDKAYNGKFGSVRVGLQYSYTKLTAFADSADIKPTTDDNMFFTSFRYYPSF